MTEQELKMWEDDIKFIELLRKENEELKQRIDNSINDLEIIIDIVRKQPLGNDCWIIDRLEANKNILKR